MTLRKLDNRDVSVNSHEMWAYLVVRDERLRLPHVMNYHRSLGIDRFLVIDNGSRDGTLDYLFARDDTHIFQTNESYRDARNGMAWIEQILDSYAIDRWSLVLDADEYLVYPKCESIKIPEICTLLEKRDLNCLTTMFIDMYANSAIADARPEKNRDLLESSRFFDSGGYFNFPVPGSSFPRMRGGVRVRLFWPEVDLSKEQELLSRPMNGCGFDEADYLTQYADVASLVEAGKFVSGWEHYDRHGRDEGRKVKLNVPGWWPEYQYMAANPDVRDAVARQRMASGFEHYFHFGRFEGRFLSPPPILSQVPLLKWERGMKLQVGRHTAQGANWQRRDAVGGALLHFRLMHDLADRAQSILATGSDSPLSPNWGDENSRYYETLKRNPRLNANISTSSRGSVRSVLRRKPISIRYRNSDHLVTLGLLTSLESL